MIKLVRELIIDVGWHFKFRPRTIPLGATRCHSTKVVTIWFKFFKLRDKSRDSTELKCQLSFGIFIGIDVTFYSIFSFFNGDFDFKVINLCKVEKI